MGGPSLRRRGILLLSSFLLVSVVLVGLLFALAKVEKISVFTVSGSSMEPLYHSGEVLFVKKPPKLSDGMTVFFHPASSFLQKNEPHQPPASIFVKHIEATPGQVLSYSKGAFYVNGKLIFSTHAMDYYCPLQKPFHLRLGKEIFVLGVNASDSLDSRYVFCNYGVNFLVPLKNVVDYGNVVFHSW